MTALRLAVGPLMQQGGPSTPAYVTEVLADSPKVYLRMVTSHSIEPDATGNGYDGDYEGDAAYNGADPPFTGGGDGRFDGSGDYVFIDDSLSFPGERPCTYEAWVYRNSGQESVLFDVRGSSFGHLCRVTTTGAIDHTFYSVASATTPAGRVGTGAWVHVAVTVSAGGERNFYVNGSLTDTISNASAPNAGAVKPLIMARRGSGGFGQTEFSGRIAEVAYYSSELSDTRIAAHYAAAT